MSDTQYAEELTKEELLKLLRQKTDEIKDLSLRYENQIDNLGHRFNDLSRSYYELSDNLLNTLWVHCAQYDPELSNIPHVEYENYSENDSHVGNYIFGEFIGEGTFAQVKSCRKFNYSLENKIEYNTKFDLAIKIIDKSKIKSHLNLKRLSDEIGNLRKLNDPSIICMKDVIHTPKYLYIVTDRGGQDLFEFLHNNPGAVQEDLSRDIVVGILQAISYIHDQGICHRDIKPENILLQFPFGYPTMKTGAEEPTVIDYPSTPVVVKVCDFGVSCKFRKKIMLQEFSGSPGFFAPEILLVGCYYGHKVDLWSIGCVLLELALGHRRFCLYWMRAYQYDILQRFDLFQERIKMSVETTLNPEMLRVNEEYHSFICLFIDLVASRRGPFKRISQHPWLRGQFKCPPASDNASDDQYSPCYPLDFDGFMDESQAMSPSQVNRAPIASPTHYSVPHSSSYNQLSSVSAAAPGGGGDFFQDLFSHLSVLSSAYDNDGIRQANSTNENMSPATSSGDKISGENEMVFQLPPSSNLQRTMLRNETHRTGDETMDRMRANRNEGEVNKVRVLLVEDSTLQMKLMTKRIQSVGLVDGAPAYWDVVQCPDGETACTMVDEATSPFDVIVIDQNLSPDQNRMLGHEVVTYCRVRFPDAVIIGCTSNAAKHKLTLLNAGADFVWGKPLPREQIIFTNISVFMKIRRPQLAPDQVPRSRFPSQAQMRRNISSFQANLPNQPNNTIITPIQQTQQLQSQRILTERHANPEDSNFEDMGANK